MPIFKIEDVSVSADITAEIQDTGGQLVVTRVLEVQIDTKPSAISAALTEDHLELVRETYHDDPEEPEGGGDPVDDDDEDPVDDDEDPVDDELDLDEEDDEEGEGEDDDTLTDE